MNTASQVSRGVWAMMSQQNSVPGNELNVIQHVMCLDCPSKNVLPKNVKKKNKAARKMSKHPQIVLYRRKKDVMIHM
jgi:hypothetical protein